MLFLRICTTYCVLVKVLSDDHGRLGSTDGDRISRLERLVKKQSEEIILLKRRMNDPKSENKFQFGGLSNSKRLLMTESPSTLSPKVAFYAYLSQNEVDPGHHHIIVFDHVETNVGNAYNNYSGTFVAPDEGVYIFAYTVVAYERSRMPVQLVANSKIVASTAADSKLDTTYPAASNIVSLYLKKGDTCFLRTTNNQGHLVGNIYSTVWSRSSFTGWKL